MKHILIILTLPFLQACTSIEGWGPDWLSITHRDPNFDKRYAIPAPWQKRHGHEDWNNYGRDQAMGLHLPKSHYGIHDDYINHSWRGRMYWDPLSRKYKPIQTRMDYLKATNPTFP